MSEQSKAGRKSTEDLLIVHQGATVADLALIFGMSPQEINKRIVGKVVPRTAINKIPRYAIAEAAPYLCNVVFDPEEFIKKMSPEKLPPKLQDAFWKAQRSRLAYEEERGELWRTSRVIGVFSDAFKAVRMTILMFGDTVEQTEELSSDQRRVIQELGDGLLDSLHKALVEEFKDYEPAVDEHGMPISEQPMTVAPPNDEECDARAAMTEAEFDDGFG